jgi:hypothetical protein
MGKAANRLARTLPTFIVPILKAHEDVALEAPALVHRAENLPGFRGAHEVVGLSVEVTASAKSDARSHRGDEASNVEAKPAPSEANAAP